MTTTATIQNDEFLLLLHKAGVTSSVIAQFKETVEQGVPPDALLDSLLKSGKYPRLNETVQEIPSARHQVEPSDQQTDSDYPALPESARLPEGLSQGACKWLDAYETFSKHWSPKGYEQFHTAVGIWILSTIAACRVYLPFGPGGEFTPFFIALVAPTSKYAKSTTAKIAKALLRNIHLSWLLTPDTVTPQKLISNMSGHLPTGYGDLSEEEQFWARKRCAMSGQVSWFYDEFGQHMDAITAKNGIMADFKGILRRLDDCDKEASNDTIARGLEKIENPYMALLACMTPLDIKPYAGKDAKFWRDGFFARFTFITPPNDNQKRTGLRFPTGEMFFPSYLTTPLQKWHEQLGEPELEIEETKNKRGDIIRYQPIRKDFPRKKCTLSKEAEEAFYRYGTALEDLVAENQALEMLAGNYQRFAKKALRIAMLIASLENEGNIELKHWARGQEIAEEWRKSLHHLYHTVTQTEHSPTFAKKIEDDVLRIVKKLEGKGKPPTIREIRQYLKGVDLGRIKQAMVDLYKAGLLAENNEGKSPRYSTFSTVEDVTE